MQPHAGSRFHRAVLTSVLAVAAFAATGAAPSWADESRPAEPAASARPARGDVARPVASLRGSPTAQPGTIDEERDYARREAESPQVQEFAGGFVIFLLTVVVLVLLIVYLSRHI